MKFLVAAVDGEGRGKVMQARKRKRAQPKPTPKGVPAREPEPAECPEPKLELMEFTGATEIQICSLTPDAIDANGDTVSADGEIVSGLSYQLC